jgi:hypothetical protein
MYGDSLLTTEPDGGTAHSWGHTSVVYRGFGDGPLVCTGWKRAFLFLAPLFEGCYVGVWPGMIRHYYANTPSTRGARAAAASGDRPLLWAGGLNVPSDGTTPQLLGVIIPGDGPALLPGILAGVLDLSLPGGQAKRTIMMLPQSELNGLNLLETGPILVLWLAPDPRNPGNRKGFYCVARPSEVCQYVGLESFPKNFVKE